MIRKNLGIASVMLMWMVCNPISAQPKAAAMPEGQWPSKVSGRGETVESAKADAFKQTIIKIRVLMERQNPPLEAFKVTEEYVRQHLVEKSYEGKEENIPLEGVDHVFKEWILVLRSDKWPDLVHRDHEAQRQHRAEARQTLTFRVVMGLAVLILAGFGYVRLDEYTQHRYTAWLRVAGVGLATTAVAGLWWMSFGA
jgi:hypothetical protein